MQINFTSFKPGPNDMAMKAHAADLADRHAMWARLQRLESGKRGVREEVAKCDAPAYKYNFH